MRPPLSDPPTPRASAVDTASLAPSVTTHYALGFIFGLDNAGGRPEDPQLALLRRQRPESVEGKLHGFGARLHRQEGPRGAMDRKVRQKSGVPLRRDSWRHFADVISADRKTVWHCLSAWVPDHVLLELILLDGSSPTDENIEVWSLHELLGPDGPRTPVADHLVALLADAVDPAILFTRRWRTPPAVVIPEITAPGLG